jgi:hypothetical protein
MIYESPKRVERSALMSVRNVDEAPPLMWVNGICWRNISEATKLKLRRHSDVFLWRVSRRLLWAQDKLEGGLLNETENDLLTLLASYLSACRSRVMSLQAIDIAFETLITTKKRLLEATESAMLGSCPPSPTNAGGNSTRGVFTAFLKVIT